MDFEDEELDQLTTERSWFQLNYLDWIEDKDDKERAENFIDNLFERIFTLEHQRKEEVQ